MTKQFVYDMGGGNMGGCEYGGAYCPTLMYDDTTDKINLIDKQGNEVTITRKDLLRLINAGEHIKKSLINIRRKQ